MWSNRTDKNSILRFSPVNSLLLVKLHKIPGPLKWQARFEILEFPDESTSRPSFDLFSLLQTNFTFNVHCGLVQRDKTVKTAELPTLKKQKQTPLRLPQPELQNVGGRPSSFPVAH